MLVCAFEIFLACGFIGFCSETGQTIVIKIYSERIETADEDIDSEIEFVPFEQERIVDILLHDTMSSDMDIYLE
jgi:hypothetical protein